MKMDDVRHKEEFIKVSENCPWRHPHPPLTVGNLGGWCEATENRKPCLDVNCALFHFKKVFERSI